MKSETTTRNSKSVKIPLMGFTPLSEDINIDYLKRLGEADFRLFYLVCDLPWLKQPGLDVNSLEKRLTELRNTIPHAQVILRVNLHPPLSWLENNPDELVRLSNGKLLKLQFISCYYRERNFPFYSLVSEKWRHDAGKELEKLMELVSMMPDGDSVIGYFFAAGRTGEWGYGIANGNHEKETFDYSVAFRKHFIKWLKRKYGTVDKLRQAWNMADIDFESIFIPPLETRSGYYAFNNRSHEAFLSNDDEIKMDKCPYAIGGFINPDTAMHAFDFLLALQEGIAESIEYFSKIVKKYSRSSLLTGAFYGEIFHAGTRKILLPSSAVDFLSRSEHHRDRCPGEAAAFRPVVNSYFLHNKAFIMEDDTRTHLAAPDICRRYKTMTLEDSLTQLKRDFGRNLCEGFYGWWFDMFIPPKLDELSSLSGKSLASGGQWWYDNPDILRLFKQQQSIAQKAALCDCSKTSSVAVIVDERSALFGSINYYEKIFYYWRGSELARIGAPVDFYYQEDLDNPDMPDYNLYIFINTFVLASHDRERIAKKIKRGNSTVLWLYAPGVCNPDADKRFSADNISELTDIKMRYDKTLIDPTFYLTDSENPVVRGTAIKLHGYQSRPVLTNKSGEMKDKVFSNEQMPNFYPDAEGSEILGRFKVNDEVALVCRNFPLWRSIYCGTLLVGSDLLRSIARSANCHIVCDSDDFIFINKSFLTIHAASDGLKKLSLPVPCHPRELYSGQDFGTNISLLKLEMKRGETRMFQL